MDTIRPIGSEDRAAELRSQVLQRPAQGAGPGHKQSESVSPAVTSGPSTDDTELGRRISAEDLETMVSKLSEHVQAFERSLRFSVDETSGRTLIKVVDTQTDEVIRQIPSEEALRILRHIAASGDGEKPGAQGFFVREQA